MTKPLEYVHIGVGGFGQRWCNDVLPRLRHLGLAVPLAAVDINPEVLAKAKQQFGLDDDRLYLSAEHAVAEHQPDFITIVVPPALHEQLVDLAVQHGCHVLSEKPIAATMEACCRVYRKVQHAGLKMAVTMSHRFDQDKQTLESHIKSGQYGRLDYIVGRNTWTARKRGQWGQFRYDIPDPLLIEGTVHHFDIIRSLSGANARTVHALTWNPPWSQFSGDSQGLVVGEMENGVKFSYEGAKANATQMNGWTGDYWRAECEKATLELDNRKLRMFCQLNGQDQFEDIALQEQAAWTNPWLAELFCRWLLGGDPPPNTIEDNIQCAALLFAAIESAHSGKTVDVQEFLAEHMSVEQDHKGDA